MKKLFTANKFLSAALVLAALAVPSTAPTFAQSALSTNNSGKSAYALSPACTEMQDWFGIAQNPPHRQAANHERRIQRSLAAGAGQNEFGAEFGYYSAESSACTALTGPNADDSTSFFPNRT
jgi:hypothetical protein